MCFVVDEDGVACSGTRTTVFVTPNVADFVEDEARGTRAFETLVGTNCLPHPCRVAAD